MHQATFSRFFKDAVSGHKRTIQRIKPLFQEFSGSSKGYKRIILRTTLLFLDSSGCSIQAYKNHLAHQAAFSRLFGMQHPGIQESFGASRYFFKTLRDAASGHTRII